MNEPGPAAGVARWLSRRGGELGEAEPAGNEIGESFSGATNLPHERACVRGDPGGEGGEGEEGEAEPHHAVCKDGMIDLDESLLKFAHGMCAQNPKHP